MVNCEWVSSWLSTIKIEPVTILTAESALYH